MKPNVLCVGFAKCGTTTFYDILKQHNDIFLPGIKEPIYYCSRKLKKKGFDWYVKRYYPKYTNKKIIMEVNPLIVRFVEPEQIKKDYGKDIKIIFLLRNPAERVYSHFKMNLVNGRNFNSKEEHIGNSTSKLFNKWLNIYFDKDKNKFKECYRTNFIKNCEYYSNIKKYIDTFGKDNIKVIIFEDFIKDPKDTCLEVYDFLGIKEDKNINYNIHSNEGNRIPINKLTMRLQKVYLHRIWRNILLAKLPYISNKACEVIDWAGWTVPKIFSKKDKHPEKMLKENKELLNKYFYNDTKKLSKLLNIDLIEKWKM